jgi:hypothetical protein
MGDDTPHLVEQLVARGDTLASLERLLQLSPGYLSKVRRRRVTASAQLLALLRVLLKHPEVRATLRPGQERPGLRGSARVPRSAARSRGLAAFLRGLTRSWAAGGVRFHPVDDLLLVGLKVALPSELERSTRFLVHPDDRHALVAARDLAATVAMASSRAAIVTPPGSSESLLVVFPLGSYHHLFHKPKLDAVDAALYFALQTGDEAALRLRVLAKAHALRATDLRRQLERDYGSVAPLPAREWLLRATFDLEGARRRLAELPDRW